MRHKASDPGEMWSRYLHVNAQIYKDRLRNRYLQQICLNINKHYKPQGSFLLSHSEPVKYTSLMYHLPYSSLMCHIIQDSYAACKRGKRCICHLQFMIVIHLKTYAYLMLRNSDFYDLIALCNVWAVRQFVGKKGSFFFPLLKWISDLL